MKFLLALVAFVAVNADFQSANENQHKFLTDPKLIPHKYQKDADKYKLVIEGENVGIVAGPQKIFFKPDTLLFDSTKSNTNDEPENECKNTPAYAVGAIGKSTLGGYAKSDDGIYCGLTTTKEKFPTTNKFNKTLPILTFTNKDHSREALVLECSTIFKKNVTDLEEIIDLKSVTDRNNIDTLYGLFADRRQKGRTVYGVCMYSMLDIREKLADDKVNTLAFNKKTTKWDKLPKEKLTADHVLAIHENMELSKAEFALLNFNFTYANNITNYAVMSFSGLDNTQYGIHYFATADGKIIKAITDGKNLNVTNDLFNGTIGKTIQMEIFQGYLLVLTTRALYSLPLFTCDSLWSCSKCVEQQDPQCLWDGNSCVQTQEWHRNQTYTQRIKDGNAEFCVSEKNDQINQRLMDLLVRQLEKAKDELAKLEQIKNDQSAGLGDIQKEFDSAKGLIESIQAKIDAVNSTMAYERSHHYTDLMITGFFAALFCVFFVVVKRVAVYAKGRFIDKDPSYGLMNSVVMGNSNDRYTSPTNGDL